MVRQVKIYKDAMHTVEVETGETWDELTQMLASDRQPSMSQRLVQLARWVSESLVQLGEPDPGRIVQVLDDGSWQYVECRPQPPCQVHQGFAFTKKRSEPLSPAHLLATIHMKVRFAHDALARGDVERAMSAGMALQRAVDIYATRAAHLKNATSGRMYRDKSKEGADKRKGTIGRDTAARLARMNDLIAKGHSVSRAAQIATDVGGRAGSNRALFYGHRQKVVRNP